MGLIDDIKQANAAVKKGPTCGMAVIINSMAEAEARELQAAMDDESIKGTIIAKVLSERGYSISGHTVSYHRRKACSCV
jgi:hypothetical protein